MGRWSALRLPLLWAAVDVNACWNRLFSLVPRQPQHLLPRRCKLDLLPTSNLLLIPSSGLIILRHMQSRYLAALQMTCRPTNAIILQTSYLMLKKPSLICSLPTNARQDAPTFTLRYAKTCRKVTGEDNIYETHESGLALSSHKFLRTAPSFLISHSEAHPWMK